ncbi:MAG TPA: tetratricopeptide repeat protein, partial [Patescibacteria group bacterium]|nr:tetratricopeptide repeat protein [Patescibacteria group bacterium]
MVTNTPSRDAAIKYALDSRWEEASRENLKLLEENPNDIDTLNRLAYSFVKLGKYRKAKEYYQMVVALDKTNPIALKNLKRIDMISKNDFKKDEVKVSGIANFQDVFI